MRDTKDTKSTRTKTLYVAMNVVSPMLFPDNFALSAERITYVQARDLLDIPPGPDVQVRRIFSDDDDSNVILALDYIKQRYGINKNIQPMEEGSQPLACPGDAILLLNVNQQSLAAYTVGFSDTDLQEAVSFHLWAVQ